MNTQEIIEANIATAERSNGHLFLTGLGLRELPPEVLSMKHLRTLDISKNQLVTLPIELQKFTDLERLDLSDNLLMRIPEAIRLLSGLKKLRISSNRLLEIDLLHELPRGLQELDVAGNQLEWIHSLGAPASLKVLNAERNCLINLQVEAKSASSRLSQLLLRENDLNDLPESLSRLRRLERLDLACNRLKQLPAVVGRLEKLNWLDVSDNALTGMDLPDDMGFKQLVVLKLASNQVATLPAWLAEAKKLSSLDISHNSIATLDCALLPAGLRTFSATNCRISTLTNLQLLDVLEYLAIQDNQLGGHLTYPIPRPLRWMDMSRNRFSSMVLTLPKNACLEALVMGGNALTCLEVTGIAQDLTRLDLAGNQLGSIPEFYVHSAYLSHLYLAGNQLAEVPDGVTCLSRLHTLTLSFNQISKVPAAIAQIKSLKYLWLDNNPLEGLPLTLLKKGWACLTLHGTPGDLTHHSQPQVLASIGLGLDDFTRVPPVLPPTSTILAKMKVTAVRIWPFTWAIRFQVDSHEVMLPVRRWSGFEIGSDGIRFTFICPESYPAELLPLALEDVEQNAIESVLSLYLAHATIARYWDNEECIDGP